MITEVLKSLILKKDTDYETMKSVMYEITEGKASEAQIASLLTALKIKGETVEEITAAAEVLRAKCIKTDLFADSALDIVGTGGDMSNTFNISTASAFIAAAGGVPIAKHGNRALTSKSGAIDVLEACGINTGLTAQKEKEIFSRLNICFMFAPYHHPALKHASKVRKELKFRTMFNILGPLTNPAGANYQVFGVYDEKLVHKLARVISNLGVTNAVSIHGKDGLDEATVTDATVISEIRNNKIFDYEITPEDVGLKRSLPDDIKGGTPKENAKIMKDIFSGKENGPKKDIVLLNSALALYLYNKTISIKDGVILARNIIDSGLARDKFEQYIKMSNEV